MSRGRAVRTMGMEQNTICARKRTGSAIVYPILDTESLREHPMEENLHSPTGLSIREMQAQKHEEWN